MNKHALFLYGDYRTFDWCHIWYANKIPENVDVYISTYSTSWEQKSGELQWNEHKKTWNYIELSEPPRPPRQSPFLSEYAITHTIQGIKQEIFQDVFGNNLRDVHISERDFNEWVRDRESTTGTTSFIIKHLQKIVGNIPSEVRKEYKNAYILRLDCLPVVDGDEIFTFDEKLFNEQFDFEANTLYSQSEEDMMNWTFAQDLVFCGRAETIINWVEYLNSEKHDKPHVHIANATGEMVEKGILKHKKFIGYNSHIIRRSMVPFFYYYWKRNINPLTLHKGRGIYYEFQKSANELGYKMYG